MSNKLVMQYGATGLVQNKQGLKLIASGEVVDATSIELTTEAGSVYLLATKEWTISSGAFRGYRLHYVVAPEEDAFGSTACQYNNTIRSGNYGVNVTYNADSTITLVQSASTYGFRYALYKLF